MKDKGKRTRDGGKEDGKQMKKDSGIELQKWAAT